MRASVSTSLIDSPIARLLINPWGSIQTILHTVVSWLAVWAPIAIPAVLILGTGLLVGRRWWLQRCQAALHHHARVVTVLAPPTVDPDGAQALWSTLADSLLRPAWKRLLFGQPHVAFEYVFSHDGVQLRFWVPGGTPPDTIEHAVHGAWPGAQTRIEEATAPLPLPTPEQRHRVLSTGGTLRLERSEALPIRTDFATDSLRQLLSAVSGLRPDERACVQVLARPATGRRLQQARHAGRRLHDGQSTDLVNRVLDVLTPGPTPPPSARPVWDRQTTLEYHQQDQAIISKQRGSQWDTMIRYAVAITAPTEIPPRQVTRLRERLRGQADGIASAVTSAYHGDNRYRRRRLRHPVEALADRRFRRGDLLSVPELAAVAHVPTDHAAPGLLRAGAKAVPPPPGIPGPGAGVRPVGVSDTGHARPIGLRVSDAREHVHVLGATGSGKSTLLAQMILADAEAGRGAVVIDPKGDLINDLLARLPNHATDKVVLIDPDTPNAVPCLNPLEGEKVRSVDNLVSVFSRVFASAWGPRTEDILRSVCLTLRTGSESPKLTEILDLLLDDASQPSPDTLTGHPALKRFWDGYQRLSDQGRAQVIAPLANKLRKLLLQPFIVQALAAGPSTVDLGSVLDGGLCLVRVPKGQLGEDTARLLGSLIVAQVWQAATARASLPQWQRLDAALYVDEAHNFLHLPIAMEDMLAEARGYRLSMTLAHQHLGQLSKDVKEGISTNARSKVFFSCSPEDARELARHTAPRISEHDLAHLGGFHAAARLVVDGALTQPFTLTTQRLPRAIRGRAKAIRAAAERHTQPPAEQHGNNTGHGLSRDPRRAA